MPDEKKPLTKQFRQIKPHGGRLIDRMATGEKRDELLARANSLPKLRLNERELADLEMIAVGAMSPLEGFMTCDTYTSVVNTMHLPLGLPWSIPVVLATKPGDDTTYTAGQDVALTDSADTLAILHLEQSWRPDKTREAEQVLRTTDEAHPGVKYLQSVGDTYLGGQVTVLRKPHHDDFTNYRLDPKETRVLFKAKGWSTITAFQTRNPIHRAHEYLQKCALEVVDGLLIHPLVGATQKGDIPADVRMRCYEVLMANYYPKDRVALSVFPAAMRYAGPREAIFHALVRKNYGCTHFIVGRDHAGVGNYYGTFDAHYIFEEFDREALDVTPLFFDHSFYCKRCGNMASSKTCPHGKDDHVILSGTKVREMLAAGEIPPVEFTRPEVAKILVDAYAKGEA